MATRGFGLLAELRLTVGNVLAVATVKRLMDSSVQLSVVTTAQQSKEGSRWVSKEVGLGVGLKVGGPVHNRWESPWVFSVRGEVSAHAGARVGWKS